MKGLLAGGLADAQPLIVVVVEGDERIGIVDDDLEECIALVCRWQRLLLQGASKHLHQLPEFGDLLLANALVYGISLDEVFSDASLAYHVLALSSDTCKRMR